MKLLTTEEFIARANLVHGNKYSYINVSYISHRSKVIISCSTHGTFEQTPSNHLQNHGCPKCKGDLLADIKRKKLAQFISEANELHDGRYDYSAVEYTTGKAKISIGCPVHKIFKQTAEHHLRGSGCPKCVTHTYSKKSIEWLDHIAQADGIVIQHAVNEGEYRIPMTKYKVDGYCNETNTIYEFYGDAYHGNLQKYERTSNCHPFDRHITAEELYLETITRENKIKDLGYNFVCMWELDWDNIKASTIS